MDTSPEKPKIETPDAATPAPPPTVDPDLEAYQLAFLALTPPANKWVI